MLTLQKESGQITIRSESKPIAFVELDKKIFKFKISFLAQFDISTEEFNDLITAVESAKLQILKQFSNQ